MIMLQLAYFSTAAVEQDATTVHYILVTARVNNRRDEISGLLVAGVNRYMQVIEGPSYAVEILYGKIRKEQRHLGVTTFLTRHVLKRSFEGWSMAFRREPALGHFDSFPDVLRQLTREIPDTELKQQIRHFAQLMIIDRPLLGRNSGEGRANRPARPSARHCPPQPWCRCRSLAP
jgi:hypothetical protein